MNLTSLNRVKNANGVTSTDNDAVFSRLIPTASNRIAFYLRRENALRLESRVHSFNPARGQSVFRLPAYPITSITSIQTDSTGLYTGSESIVSPSDYGIGADLKTVWFSSTAAINNPLLQVYSGVYPNSLRMTYVAGLAASGTVSAWSMTPGSGTLTAGKFTKGTLSGSVGKLTAVAADSLSYECIYGIFEAEPVQELNALDNALTGNKGASDPTNATATLIACTSQSLAEAHPDLTQGCEMYVRYLWKNADNFNNLLVSRDGENRTSRADNKNDSILTPEVREIVDTYRNRYAR